MPDLVPIPTEPDPALAPRPAPLQALDAVDTITAPPAPGTEGDLPYAVPGPILGGARNPAIDPQLPIVRVGPTAVDAYGFTIPELE